MPEEGHEIEIQNTRKALNNCRRIKKAKAAKASKASKAAKAKNTAMLKSSNRQAPSTRNKSIKYPFRWIAPLHKYDLDWNVEE